MNNRGNERRKQEVQSAKTKQTKARILTYIIANATVYG